MEKDVIIERIDNLKEFFKNEFEQNKEEHQVIQKRMKIGYDDHEHRIRKLEDWKLVFVAKYSIYSAIALVIGSLLGTFIINVISKYI